MNKRDEREAAEERAATQRIERIQSRLAVIRHSQRKGTKPDWQVAVPKCKCRLPYYVHGRFVQCGKDKCQRYVDEFRRIQLSESKIMAERKKNAAFWKQMRARHTAPIRAYAKKYGVSYEQAKLELEYKAMLEEIDREYLVQEGLRFDRKSRVQLHEE